MRVQHSQMRNILELSKAAEVSSVKSLDQSERKILMVMLSALKRGEASVHLEGVDQKKLERMKIKLQTPQEVRASSFIQKVVKIVLNFFGFRTGSRSVVKAVESTKNLMEECQMRLNSLKPILDNKKEALSELIEQGGARDEIEHLRQDIEKLNRELSEIEGILTPKEDVSVAYVQAKKEAIASFQNQIPSLIEDAKAKVSENDAKELIEQNMQLDLVKNPNRLDNEQFEKDYLRPGFRLRIEDPSKGVFQGYPKPSDSTKPADYYAFHKEGFNHLFASEEKIWKHFIQAAVTQTPVNAMMVPLHMEMNINPEGRLRHLDVMGKEVPVIFDLQEVVRNVDVEVHRNSSGVIEKVTVSIRMDTPVETGMHLAGLPKPKSLDTIGVITSTMRFELSLKDGNPLVGHLKYDHVFNKDGRKPEPQASAPGFTPLEKKKGASPQLSGLEKMKAGWRSDLSRKKLSIQPTGEKICWLEGRLGDLRAVQERVDTRLEKESIGLILNSYRSYLEELTR
ncbi:hypothetical protein [Estrella lausannensis]|uniref:Uncharacterized protein n=1 Tax=Estrella lausannensis TaxID=483423 RepID=A0A0H5DSS6_9BACT|nr:hypothetical protein [Estrella lausannensis]CRX38859.1 hypothetical protein ELAC_1531 [Estrella lausannensis]